MSRLIGFLLYEILSRPEPHQELTAEVDAHFGQGVRDAADLRQMKLLRATYLENLRYHPVSQGMPFLCERDFVVEGKQIQREISSSCRRCPWPFRKRRSRIRTRSILRAVSHLEMSTEKMTHFTRSESPIGPVPPWAWWKPWP